MILFSAKISHKHHEKLKEKHSNLEFIFCDNMDEAKQHLHKAKILVTYGGDLNEGLIGQAENLKWIMVMSAGIEKMPFEAIEQKGILVTNARGIHQTPMAEYAISMLLQVYREARVLYQSEKDHHWDRFARMQEMRGRRMLLMGAGSIGQEVARLAKAFQVETIGVSRSGRSVEYFDENHKIDNLENLLPSVDIVVSILPSTEETRGLFTFKHFQLLPNHAVFLNMGRGDLVHSDDLLKAARQGEVAHIVLDVFEEEPLPADHPFWGEENVTITPHIAGLSPHYTRRALGIFEHNLQCYLTDKGEYVNKVDVTRGY
ncbi:D-2-hydroxyacid dehydrogenase [Virgibacillus sp. NKC19-16]|uniref:D-2-hydroxyacid dehydrogenase n=1 Tax=Virgibacillus salidurans TaxID=2831673 RepID=UPI001F1A4CDA|nr:D-2-hydroxyacid dehydrogenase [Virgibacillus sp. NKC19-16]UJL47324.1 D-2-hydroxyacid dehydrogenase [Virgibacillus sp. NKC19-16]